MARHNVFRITSIRPEIDTRQLIEELAQAEESGDLVGTVVISMYRRARGRGRAAQKQFELSLSGWAAQNPVLASGTMSACQVLINDLALQEAGLVP